MKVEQDKVVSFHYELKDVDGNLLEASSSSYPSLYLHGHNNMLQGIETALEGKQDGENVSVTLEQDDAYGRRRENAAARVPLKNIQLPDNAPVKGKLKPGQIVLVKTPQGMRDARVVKHGLKAVDIDTNHPFAGMTLVFDINIVSVREATAEELAHGHAHGDGGHQH
ncbi:peptidylprolyl isomerase [Teredinibacter sp. KSP-S5-2]|uniref:FKBP-type peptidyl-prolyl cis-trans isomerase n=1 Tax=Teredinibacter sp. KSP-S5-2 TaxID=3034506 RepID=UPI002934F652|nr:FKBP-type peptidyl-prolyl cis-trans isomerase [Teredinibacter sp. KSP-S5-2]WNO10131.1 FKBP-type peptidyl-prolyl cis-trans isomerase [Teredinibacter sp. KSP-S5-2]